MLHSKFQYADKCIKNKKSVILGTYNFLKKPAGYKPSLASCQRSKGISLACFNYFVFFFW